jgi:hypothetical protein
VASVRCRVEKIFGATKRSYGLGRARYRGLARASLQAHLTFLAYNPTRTAGLRAERAAARPAGDRQGPEPKASDSPCAQSPPSEPPKTGRTGAIRVT